MEKVTPAKLQDALKVLADLELTMGEFYKTCADTWPEDRAFWITIYRQEQQHAHYIEKMSSLIADSPEKFMLGKRCNPAAINTVISGIRKNIELVKANALTKIKTLYIACDLEKSALENKIDEIVTTGDPGFMALAQEIVAQTKHHREQFTNRRALIGAHNTTITF